MRSGSLKKLRRKCRQSLNRIMSKAVKKPASRGAAEGREGGVDLNEVARGTRGFIDKILGDVSKSSATKQVIWGGASGWCTGFVSMRVGKAAATALGGGVLLLTIAQNQGYISIDWDRLMRHVDRVTDRAEEAVTGEGPGALDKMERYVNRKLDKAESALRNRERRVKRWYHNFVLGEEDPQIKEFQIFVASFVTGLAVGVLTGK